MIGMHTPAPENSIDEIASPNHLKRLKPEDFIAGSAMSLFRLLDTFRLAPPKTTGAETAWHQPADAECIFVKNRPQMVNFLISGKKYNTQ